MALQGLCSQVMCTATLPAALPGWNTFMGHSHGQSSAGLTGMCSSTSIRFLFKSTPSYFLLLIPKKIQYALIWTWRILLLSLKHLAMLYETQACGAIAWETDCPHLPPADAYCQGFHSLIITRTNIPRCYGKARLLKKERKKKEATNQRFQTAVNLLNCHLLAQCQGSCRYLWEATHYGEAALAEWVCTYAMHLLGPLFCS